MISFTAQRKQYFYPRLYVREDPYYRYTRIFLTRLGFASVAIAGIVGGFFTALTVLLVK